MRVTLQGNSVLLTFAPPTVFLKELLLPPLNRVNLFGIHYGRISRSALHENHLHPDCGLINGFTP